MDTRRRLEIVRRAIQRRAMVERRRLRDLSDPLDIPEAQFMAFYRLSQDVFIYLCSLLRDVMLPTIKSSAVPLELKVLGTLSFLATGSYQKIVGNDATVSMSQPSLSRHMHAVVEGLNRIMNNFIKFPVTVGEREYVKQGFFRRFRMPGVIGCIDGTHIAIVRPANNEEIYFNRKGYHSINVTVICDANLKVLAVNAKYGGAAHDAHVWANMHIRQVVEDANARGEKGWLLGDSAYPQRAWLMTPILHAAENTPELHYTNIHCSTRNCIERCFGVLKARWRCLLRHRVLHYTPIFSAKIFNACAVLHNICVDARLTEPEMDYNEEIDLNNILIATDTDENPLTVGRSEREELIRLLLLSNEL